jgi:hypothetical protein
VVILGAEEEQITSIFLLLIDKQGRRVLAAMGDDEERWEKMRLELTGYTLCEVETSRHNYT